MNTAVLEVEKLVASMKENAQISTDNASETKNEWEEGYASGARVAYEDAYEQCEQILTTLTKVYKGTQS